MKKYLICLSILFSFLFICNVKAYVIYDGVTYDEDKITEMAREAFNDNDFNPNNYYTFCTYYQTADPNYVFDCSFLDTPILSLTKISSNRRFTSYSYDKLYYVSWFQKILNRNEYSVFSGYDNSVNVTGDNIYSNFDLIVDGNLRSANLNFTDTPDYLTGYKKITLTSDDKYYMLSGLSSGSVYIPASDFETYGGRLSYYDNDLNSQPYTSYIQDYYKMSDGLYIRQDFNLSNYVGADWVMFSKYIYLEGEDNISYDIYVPDDIYDSEVTITPNSSGGNTFDFDYEDSNGDIQDVQINSVDLSQTSPLIGNIFNDFSSNTFGLTSIITAPLSLIQSLSSTSCTPLNLPLPFVGGTLTLPCMYDFYSNTFGSLFILYQTITFGLVAYWVLVRIFNMVKDFKNPDHDEIEVVDL